MDQLYHLQDYGGLKLLYITPEKFCRRCVCVRVHVCEYLFRSLLFSASVRGLLASN